MESRINKYISSCGVCSRRAADALVLAGKVKINGKTAQIGDKVSENDTVTVNGRPVNPQSKEILIALNKPRGIVCTASDKQGGNDIVHFVGCKERIFPVGRLDKDSEGLILLTNNGEIMNRMISAKYQHEKEYAVTVNKPVTEEFLKKMRGGLYLKELDKFTAPCRCEKLSKTRFKIVLIQGLNRQIRRMCGACGYGVTKLKRVRIMNIHLGTLPLGKWRELTNEEHDQLMKDLGLTSELRKEHAVNLPKTTRPPERTAHQSRKDEQK